MTIYRLTYKDHHKHYNFFDSEKIVSELIKQVKYRHVPKDLYQVKADFSIENKHNAVIENDNTADIKTLRYWSTDVYCGVHFNSFIATGIKNDILKHVINVGLSGSSWHFNKFSHLNLKVLNKTSYSTY